MARTATVVALKIVLTKVHHSNQIYLVTLAYGQLTQASFLQKNQMLQNGFLIFLTLSGTVASKIMKSGHSKSIFYVRKRPNLSKKKFSLKNINLGPHFL